MSLSEPHVFSLNKSGSDIRATFDEIAEAEHIHTEDGRCYKDRSGECTAPKWARFAVPRRVTVTIPERTAYADLPKVMQDTLEARRLMRLDLRMLLNQHNGTFTDTNRLADVLADAAVRTLQQEGIVPRD